jgi:Protein of unknown function (DUF3443)
MVGTTLLVRCARTVVLAPAWRFGLCAALCLAALSCGGGGGSVASLASGGSGSSGSSAPTGSNVVSVVVDAGPTSTSPDINTLFTTVTVCVPGTTSCQTIDHIQVDTGSFGLRILSPVLTVALPVQTFTNGASLLECTAFVDGYSWGPVALADVQISDETASSVPVQVIGDPNFTSVVPSNCSSVGPAEDTVVAFGANGILGVGVFAQDCGSGCVTTADNDVYYSCTSTLCEPTTVTLASQVTDPVALFAMDNNGVIIQLPTVAAQGAATVTGSMIFGIDTQTNNKSGGQKVLTVDATFGDFTTVFNGQTLNQSFLDTGSNGLYFNDTSIKACAESGLTDFYCPAATQSFSATLQGQNAVSASVNFSVGDAATLGDNDASLLAFPTLAGPYTNSADTFDWGLPFYYGRTVYTAFENETTSVGTGPYVAF